MQRIFALVLMSNHMTVLENLGFTKEEDGPNRLAITTAKSERVDLNTDTYTPYTRYSVDAKGTLTGLHSSGQEWSEPEWAKIEAIITDATELQVLYLNGTPLKSLTLTNKPRLTHLNLSENPQLTTLTFTDLPQLTHLHASFCKQLHTVELVGDFSCLTHLDISSGQVSELRLECKAPNLASVLAWENPIRQIKWSAAEFKKLYWFRIDGKDLADVALARILEESDEALRTALNLYLEELRQGEIEVRLGLKLILIGNTTVGKSTLRRILLAEPGEEEKEANNETEKSTHGVKVFSEKFTFKEKGSVDKDVYVQGFDFGGQDYYHATHLPFYQSRSLNVVVYGYNDLKECALRGNTNAYEYGTKEVEDLPETLFPIDYWLGSLQNEEKAKNEPAHLMDRESKKDHPDATSKPTTTPKDPANVLILQNVFKLEHFQELNNYSLKQREDVRICDIQSFHFWNEAAGIRTYLLTQLRTYAKEQEILGNDQKLRDILDALQKEGEVIFTASEIENENSINQLFEADKSRIKGALKRLHDRHMGYFIDYLAKEKTTSDSSEAQSTAPEEDYLFISDIETASSWIHAILAKEVRQTKKGYVTEKDTKIIIKGKEGETGITWDGNIKPNFEKIVRFLEHEKVLFKFQEEGRDTANKWVAPAYLPPVTNRTDQLFLQVFDTPDTVIEFNEFFHSNIVQILISQFQKDLIKDQHTNTYLLWKNKVLLAQENKQNEKQIAMLLLELFYPFDEGYEAGFPPAIQRPEGFLTSDKNRRMPILKIRRNQAALVQDAYFNEVFQFLSAKLESINKKQIWIKSRLGNYIPHDLIERETTTEVNKRSGLIFFDDVLYSRYDFRKYYLGDQPAVPTKVFIAYSRHDLPYVEELLLHLKPYQMEVFYDRDLKMGDKWDEELKHQLISSDLVLCMVSPHMLNTAYVTDLELPLAQEHNILIAPIIIHECQWHDLSLQNEDYATLGDLNAKDKGIPLPDSEAERHKVWMKIAIEAKDFRTNKNKKTPQENGKGTLSQTP